MSNQKILFISTPHTSKDSGFYKLYEQMLEGEEPGRFRAMMSGRRTGKSWLDRQMNDLRLKGLRPDLMLLDELEMESGEIHDGRVDEFGRILCIRNHIRYAIFEKQERQILFPLSRSINSGIITRVENCPSISPIYSRERRPCLCGYSGRCRESIVPFSYLSLEKGRSTSE